MVRPLNQAALMSFCRDLGEALVRTGADLPEDHPLSVEMAGMTQVDQERVSFFLDGILFEHETGGPLRSRLASERFPIAQDYVADWQRREAARVRSEARAAKARLFVRRALWVAFWLSIAVVFLLDQSGVLDRAAGGR